ncbi:hypothetical protein GGS20DRAFT_470747 [Poronia punctata]|nr:hypothetical protein GGS20DRAFT_470747 [Poronia punctata]
MTRPRKRKQAFSANVGSTTGPPSKKKKHNSRSLADAKGQHPILSQYYPQVQTLREYVIAKLPATSRIRRRKVTAVGIVSKSPDKAPSEVERSLGALLDTTFVGIPSSATDEEGRLEEWRHFSQRGDESYVTLSNGVTGFAESQALIVEYVIRTIFTRQKSAKWPDHLLCDGFRRNGGLGLRAIRPNNCVTALQQSPWPELLALLGESGDRIMIDLLLDCAIFVSVKGGLGSVCQISGKSLSNATPYCRQLAQERATTSSRSPSEIVFMRNRMFYARAALNARGQIMFGLRHIHVLNRCPIFEADNEDQEMSVQIRVGRAEKHEMHTLKVMIYMFPKQFGLHNVFTSKVDVKETSHRLKDYTLREDEIVEKLGRLGDEGVHVKIPKRLRGRAKDLVHKLQVLHQRCSYSQLLQHYCPTSEEAGILKPARLESSLRNQR